MSLALKTHPRRQRTLTLKSPNAQCHRCCWSGTKNDGPLNPPKNIKIYFCSYWIPSSWHIKIEGLCDRDFPTPPARAFLTSQVVGWSARLSISGTAAAPQQHYSSTTAASQQQHSRPTAARQQHHSSPTAAQQQPHSSTTATPHHHHISPTAAPQQPHPPSSNKNPFKISFL